MPTTGEERPRKKYMVDEENRKRFPEPLFTTVVTHEVNSEEVEKFLKRNKRLPDHVYLVEASDG